MFGRFWRKSEQAMPEMAPPPITVAPPQPAKTVTLPVEDLYDDKPAILRALDSAKAHKRAWLQPYQVAERVVAWLRAEGYCAYPYLSRDLDESVAHWCELNNVFPPDPQQVREFIASDRLGVRHTRERLNRGNARHAFLIQRLEARGKKEPRNGWRMWIYYISEEIPAQNRATPYETEAKPVRNRRGPKPKPAPVRASRPEDWDVAPPWARDNPDQGVDDFVIGEELQQRRRFA